MSNIHWYHNRRTRGRFGRPKRPPVLPLSYFEASVYLMKTKEALKNCLLPDKSEFYKNDITKAVLNQLIDRIVIKDEKTATVYFKSRLIMEKDFIKTIE